MIKLSREKFQSARNFIMEHARPIDQALFSFFFEEGDKNKVLEALKKFQNEDGGFGNAIEPDFRLTISSPMATTIGLQVIKAVGISYEEKAVQAAIQYLIRSFDHEKQRWHAVPKEINQVPHAPWWEYNIEEDRCGVEGTWANPSAEIAGYLHQHHHFVPKEFLDHVTDVAFQEAVKLPEKIDMHDFLCYQRLLDALPEHQKGKIKAILQKSVRLTVSPDPKDWGGYAATPLHIVISPSSAFYKELQEEVEVNLDFEIKTINEDGSWKPNWSWFGQYEEEWKQAEREWAGHLTVMKLKTLKEFNRIEE
ncbi:hypothetical protein SAMN05877753_10885 [Bacillus oleivorans]|uniref:Prenyltransferase/squalene oxidase-like repeat protein n=1 Tax=Bacillus oleivorans TaxID=1448271 RepID=A0A285D2E6_9BACI|nr:hypothetical protein [Bacillus oleivorans]SNX73997.1 hypothetical protein SAMN05877753_10885 [Bacillus oleivorans]